MMKMAARTNSSGGQILRRCKQRIKKFRWTFENSCGICCVADTQIPFVAKQKGNSEECTNHSLPLSLETLFKTKNSLNFTVAIQTKSALNPANI